MNVRPRHPMGVRLDERERIACGFARCLHVGVGAGKVLSSVQDVALGRHRRMKVQSAQKTP